MTKRVIEAMTNRLRQGYAVYATRVPLRMKGHSLSTWQKAPAPSPGQSITEQDAFVSHPIPSAFADIFLPPLTGNIAGGHTRMLVERGNGTYVYSTQRVNGKPVTRSIGKSSSLNLQRFVARQYEWKRWALRYRFRPYGVENGTFSSGASRSAWINCNHIHMLIN